MSAIEDRSASRATLDAFCQDALAELAQTGTLSTWYRQAIYVTMGELWHRYREEVWDALPPDTSSRKAYYRYDKAGIVPFPRIPQPTVTQTIGHRRRNTLWYLTAAYGYRRAMDLYGPAWHAYPLSPSKDDFFWVAYQAWFYLISQIYAGLPWESVLGPFLPWFGPYDAGGSSDWLYIAFTGVWDEVRHDTPLLYPLLPIRDDLALQPLLMDVPFFVGLGLRELHLDEGAFWHWWLTEAVPQAWAAHQE